MAKVEESGLNSGRKRTALLVAHPDDEVLWAGGTILMHPMWAPTVAVLCRASDPDRAPKFFEAVKRLGATGAMADLEDGPEQRPLAEDLVAETALSVLPDGSLDLLITHSPFGEYTRHLRHEETGRAALALWESRRVAAKQLWMFAYEDSEKRHLPRAIESAHEVVRLPERIWRQKRSLITEVYGYGPDSFEARTAPRREAFWCFRSPQAARKWME